jgi:2-oxoglutarate ferredoxin oxidoreductase subunit delta
MRSRDHFKTKFIALDTEKCKACWKCQDKCSKKVIGKIDLFFHKHARLKNIDDCTGCLKCVKVCEYEALISLNNI